MEKVLAAYEKSPQPAESDLCDISKNQFCCRKTIAAYAIHQSDHSGVLYHDESSLADVRQTIRDWVQAALFGKAGGIAATDRLGGAPGRLREARTATVGDKERSRSARNITRTDSARTQPSEIVVRLPQPVSCSRPKPERTTTTTPKASTAASISPSKWPARKRCTRTCGAADKRLRCAFNCKGPKNLSSAVHGGDGPSWDQSDWADAAVTLELGERLWLDEMTVVGRETRREIPFSFTYDGKSSAQLLATWKRTSKKLADENGRQRHEINYTIRPTGWRLFARRRCSPNSRPSSGCYASAMAARRPRRCWKTSDRSICV